MADQISKGSSEHTDYVEKSKDSNSFKSIRNRKSNCSNNSLCSIFRRGRKRPTFKEFKNAASRPKNYYD